ncbi:MAG: CoB--CoM heterodisulfide reductase iron-sulfur subunit B family protein [Deltaproteobacteria bacterium]|nr:CoB--CoM heterodisulfide reductase iron-sulfur subunit B family protein [Deltaproteobacteria bacterium]MCL4872984.1 CoB--CoM heterodisulfide reductase iron-sulfur subunit B family protein [bacterium]
MNKMDLMKIPYYPGCTLNTVAKQFDSSARDSALAVGFEMAELKQWNCCGATFPLAPDNLMGLTAPAKVLSGARKEGDTLTTLCSVCYNVLKRTNSVIRESKEKRGVVNGFIEEEYDGSLNVLHYLEVLRDRVGFEKVKGAVKRPLKGVKAGAYYGCMLLRPFEDVGIDNAERPTIFEDLLKALGAEPVEFPNRIECCGAHLAMNDEEVVTRLSGAVIDSAAGMGAELIVTSCPLCQYNLEKSRGAASNGVPVIYFTQALGLALGQEIETLGFEKNSTDVMPLLKKKGIV